MKENLDIFSSNLINNDINNNIVFDSSIKKLQQNLFLMGFDILMINKIISYFNITTESEAIDYLIKDENGMWNHPFIPKEKFKEQTENSLLNPQKIVINNVFTRFKSNSLNENANNNIVIENDICDICEESIDFHNIKNYEIKNKINDNNEEPKDSINLENKNNNKKNKNILIDEEEEEEKNKDECPICMGDFENSIEIEKCKHKFCYGCFNSYLNNLIIKNQIQQISCPKYKCPNNNLSEEFFSQYLSEEQYFKYRQFKSKNEIARDAKKFFCPYCDSYAQIEGNIENYDSNNPNYKKSILKCMNSHQFCSCGRPIHENECYHDDKEFEELIETEKIKKCPKCGFLIKKNRGCNHMTCGNPICKYEFCWLCMNEAVPGHYEFGPCAGKQFFDPDSFSYQLRVNHPFLSFFYEIFMFILGTILFILAFVAVPGIGLSFLSYGLIYDFDDLRNEIGNEIIKFFLFLICICICFCCQSIVYIAWALIAFVTTIIISSLIIGALLTVISYIFRCIFCPDSIGNNSFNEIINNNENNEIEMANSINNDSNNN